MKKLISLLLALVMILSLSTVAFAVGEDGETQKEPANIVLQKTYSLTNPGTTIPDEIFTFKFSNGQVKDAAVGVTAAPSINDATVSFSANDFVKDGEPVTEATKNVDFGLRTINWPSFGVYTYTVKESKGNNAGVGYSEAEYTMKVTVVTDDEGILSVESVSFTNPSDEKTGIVNNTYSAGSLAVKKVVTGNLGDKTKEFEVTVTFTAPTGKTVSAPITYVEDGETKTIAANWTDGVATAVINLHDQETVTFTNIPYGVTYKVEEDTKYTTEAEGGYKTADYDFDDDNKKIDTASDNVTITNEKESTVDTGVVLDTLPYVMILAVAAVCGMALLLKKRHMAD